MKIRNFRVSRRSATLLAVMIGTLSLAIGAHAALYKRAVDATKIAAVAPAANGAAKVAWTKIDQK